jgi:superfamily II DNA or RNA helicase
MLSNLPEPSMRLGLSATPEIFYSKNKTERLMNFFGGIVAEYSLEDAIREQKLVPYKYYPHFVKLTEEEKVKYNEITKKIVRLIGYDIEDMNDKYAHFSGLLEILLFSRARIIYGAEGKIKELENIVTDIANQKNLIIYCGPTSYLNENNNNTEKDSLTQLETVNKLLGNMDIKFAQYTSKETEIERKNALQAFTSGDYSTLVAIKCLDEGVNIPQIERAIIMASSTNPREFVQRRGRILRTYPGKTHSEIHDFVVFDSEYPLLCKKEISRVVEFSKLAINKDELIASLDKEQRIIYMEVLKYGKEA